MRAPRRQAPVASANGRVGYFEGGHPEAVHAGSAPSLERCNRAPPRCWRSNYFDPCTFLERGVAGSPGGWQKGDDTGRMLVPGPVAVLDETGGLTAVDPRDAQEDAQEQVVEVTTISWEDFVDFLWAGQAYQ